MGIATKGLQINVQETGRSEVSEPISAWPEVDGLQLSDRAELSLDVLSNSRVVRVKVGEALLPAINLDDEIAVLINDHGVTHDLPSGADGRQKKEFTSPQFSPNGASKGKDVSFYGTPWAQRRSMESKSETMV